MSGCQLLHMTGKLYGKIQWRIDKGDGDFLERNTVQTFKQQVCTFCVCTLAQQHMLFTRQETICLLDVHTYRW